MFYQSLTVVAVALQDDEGFPGPAQGNGLGEVEHAVPLERL